MQRYVDIVFGFISLLSALLVPLVGCMANASVTYYLQVYILPALWILSVALMMVFRTQPLRHYWWVWISAPVALAFWIIIGVVALGLIA